MVRENKIKELVYDKVANLLGEELTKHGFKYLKSKKHFLRQEKGFNQIINLYSPYSPLSYNEKTEQLFLTFNVSSEIEIPDFEKWHIDKLGERSNFSFRIKDLTSQLELSFDDFDKDSFYTPTAAQEFKRNVTLCFMDGSNLSAGIIPLNELMHDKIPHLISDLSEKSSILNIFESREYPLQHTFLLVYGGFDDLASEQLDKTYQYYIDEIESKLKHSETEANGLIEQLEGFIKKVQKIKQNSYSNPYKRAIKVIGTKNDNFDFSSNILFCESLRLDISQFDIKSSLINSNGDILLFADNSRITKLNSNGEITFEKEIETKTGFERIFWDVPSGIIEATNEFYINNFIITQDNKILELPLPAEKSKTKKQKNPHIRDLAFCENNQKYLVIYENNFLTYSRNGELENSIAVPYSSYNKIIVDKEWLVIQEGEKVKIILDFDGQLIGTYEAGHGNIKYAFSNRYEKFILFGYSTKSQFYDLTNGKKETLWAHPTFIKEYKEILYNNTEHNFGMEIAKFSPDDKYIVGGAYHGKYVAWALPKLNRIELIPQKELIDQLEPQVVASYSETGSKEIITKAETVVLDNQIFLKNRGNNMSNIVFFNNGDIFLTELGYGKFILSWDRNFNNLTYKKIEGRLNLQSQRYLTQRTKAELIIYTRK